MIERHIDYLQVSIDFPQFKCRDNQYKIIPPVRFYKVGYQDEKGVRYYYGNPKSKKALCVCGGSALQNYREQGNSDGQICANFAQFGASCSRIDLAVTEYIENELVVVEDVESWYTSGRITSSLVSGGCKEILEVSTICGKQVQTLYIGDMVKRGEKGIFRAYDKGVEMNLESHIITRLELEDRGDRAMATFRRIAKTGDVAANFRARFDVADDEFERLMQAPAADTTRGQNLKKRAEIEVRNMRWEWLIKQVAPALRQAMLEDKSLELGDERLTEFLVKSGLQALMSDTVNKLAKYEFAKYLRDNGLVD